jgi:hypothetical protein
MVSSSEVTEAASACRIGVSLQKTVLELRDSLTREGRSPIVEPVKVSPRKKAELQGFGFEIKPLSSIEQMNRCRR